MKITPLDNGSNPHRSGTPPTAAVFMLALMLPLAAFVLGCALQLQQPALWEGWIYGFFCLLALIGMALSATRCVAPGDLACPSSQPAKRIAAILWTGILAAVLGFGQAGWRAAQFSANALDSRLEGVDLRVTGVIAAMPQRDESGLRFRMDVESAQTLGEGGALAVKLPPHIQLAWYRSLPRLSEDAAAMPFAELAQGAGDLRAGERWQLVVRLKAPHGNLNPHGFDYELWLWEQGIQATGYVRATAREWARGEGPAKLGDTWQRPLEAQRQRVREAIFERVSSPQLAGVIAALAVGDQASIDRADWDIYRATGVAHLMSISGLHVTLFAWGAALIFGALWRRSMRLSLRWAAQHAALIGGLLFATAYALFSGWGIPAQRTVLMLCAVAALRLSGKRWPWPLTWLLVLAVVVALDPWALRSAGFWLSFVAVGILFASTVEPSRAQEPQSVQRKLLHRLCRMLREQGVITLALAPLSLLLFNQVSMVGLLANALAIPFVTLLVTPLALLGVILPSLWQVAAACVQLLGSVLGYLAQLPFVTVSMPTSPAWLAACAMAGASIAVMRLPWAVRCAGALMVLPMLLISPARPQQAEFALLAADIGQGNAVLVQTAHHSLLYDAGPRFSRESDAGQRTIVPLLRALGEELDVLMVSHRDADHIGGAAAVLQMQGQARLVSSIESGHELNQVRPSERCIAGQRWRWDGVDFEILHPQPQDYDAQTKPNAMSCVLRVSNGHRSALLAGDLEAAQEARLVQSGVWLKADVLLVPHHGSKTSSSAEFLDAVQPTFAWVQAGYRNRFSHPVPEVLSRYEARAIPVIQSPRCGAARWHSAAPLQVSCQRQSHQKYWHHRLP
jgi:competence protein ComEC